MQKMNGQEASAPSAEAADIVLWARDVAERYLAPLGRRWTHVQRVAARASEVGWRVGPDSPTLIAAAYLHDIGYAPALVQSGFHPLDGARFVQRHGYDRIARLVAHHTGARVEAVFRGLDRELEGFPFANSELDQLLTYCDLTTGPSGDRVCVSERVEEICQRYGPDHVVARSARRCLPAFLAIELSVERRRR
jgi:hypothetical protein